MKKLNIKIWLLGFAMVSIFACSNDDDQTVFDDAPANRAAQRNDNLEGLLVGQANGYKGVYFTKNDEFGGFTFFLRFNSDGTVDMTSDFDENTGVESSSYEVRLGTTTELVFTTRNHIQKVSDPSYTPLIGTGYKGTSVFQYFSEDNGTITFRDVRNRNSGILVLSPSNFANFDADSVTSAETSLANRDAFVNSNAVTAFPFLSVEADGVTTEYALNYNNITLFANPLTINDDGSVSDEEFGIAFTEDGLVISPALNVNGVEIEEFIFDDTSGFEYIANVGGITAKIGYGNTPVVPLDPYAFGVRRNFAVFNTDEPFKSSNAFINFYTATTAQIEADWGLTIAFVFYRSLNDGGQPRLQFNTNFGGVTYDVDFEVEDGIVVFSLTGASNAPPIFQTILQPLIDVFIGTPQGFYLDNTGNLLNFSNRTFSMIDVADPTITINYWDF